MSDEVKEWSLNWPKNEPPINEDGTKSSTILVFREEEIAKKAFEKLKPFFESWGGCTVSDIRPVGGDEDDEVPSEPIYRVMDVFEDKVKRLTAVEVSVQSTIYLTTFDLSFSESTSAYIDAICDLYDDYDIFVIDHKRTEIPCPKKKCTIIEHIGESEHDEGEKDDPLNLPLSPNISYELFLEKQLIGRAKLTYPFSELEENAPVILLFEIKQGFRGRGYGRAFLKVIEKQMADCNAIDLWASDIMSTENTDFWVRMGYDNTAWGEEAVKELDPP